jgi:hypothetical protein
MSELMREVEALLRDLKGLDSKVDMVLKGGTR